MNYLEIALLIASMGTILVQATLHQLSLRRVLFHHEQSIRFAQAQNDKLTSKMIALCNGTAYMQYRAGSQQGVPEGSVPPVLTGENGEMQIPDAQRIERIQAEVMHRLKERERDFSSAGPYAEGAEP